ncbi:MAG: VanZ family protein [Endomicrobiia bacterium]
MINNYTNAIFIIIFLMKPSFSQQNFVIFWLPVILWSSVIFFWSSIPYLKISVLEFWDIVLRKLAHITEFAILTFLYYRAINKNNEPQKFMNHFWPIFLTLVFAITDEIHQHFVPGRVCSWKDVLIDSVGILVGSFVYLKTRKK